MKKIKEIIKYREMIFGLVKKDLRGRYKGSVLGFLWTFINPLLQILVYSIVFSTIMRAGIEKYHVFLCTALIPWIFFSTSIVGGAGTIIDSKDMVTKIYFPRHVLPIAYVTSCFINMLFSYLIVFLVILISNIGMNVFALLYLPLIMVIEYMLALGFTFVFSAVTVYFRDMKHILDIVSMAWMYLTPIMYSKELVPEEYMTLYSINPMVSVVTAYRDILYYKEIPSLGTLLPAFLLGVVVLVVGFMLFSCLEKHFAEEL